MVRYNKIFSAVLCCLGLLGSCFGSSDQTTLLQGVNIAPAVKAFLNVLVLQHPAITFAVCVAQDGCQLVVDASYLSACSGDVSTVRSVDSLNPSDSEEITTSTEPAMQVPLTAFHVATMSSTQGYHQLPRPPKVIITPVVISRPQDQHAGAAPMGHLVPSVPNSVWRSVSEQQLLFWVFVAPVGV